MSQEKVKAFFEKIEEDENLNDSYKSIVKGMADSKLDEENAMKEVVQFASQNGYEFTSEDLKIVAKDMMPSGELSDEQLENVSGGALGWVMLGGASWETGGGMLCFIAGHEQ